MNAPPPAAHDDREPRRPPERADRRTQPHGRRTDDEEILAKLRHEHEEAERLKAEKRRAERWALAKPIIATMLGFLTAEAWNAMTTNKWRDEIDVRVRQLEAGTRSLQIVRCLDPYTSENIIVAAGIECDRIVPGWREIRDNEIRRLAAATTSPRSAERP